MKGRSGPRSSPSPRRRRPPRTRGWCPWSYARWPASQLLLTPPVWHGAGHGEGVHQVPVAVRQGRRRPAVVAERQAVARGPARPARCRRSGSPSSRPPRARSGGAGPCRPGPRGWAASRAPGGRRRARRHGEGPPGARRPERERPWRHRAPRRRRPRRPRRAAGAGRAGARPRPRGERGPPVRRARPVHPACAPRPRSRSPARRPPCSPATVAAGRGRRRHGPALLRFPGGRVRARRPVPSRDAVQLGHGRPHRPGPVRPGLVVGPGLLTAPRRDCGTASRNGADGLRGLLGARRPRRWSRRSAPTSPWYRTRLPAPPSPTA